MNQSRTAPAIVAVMLLLFVMYVGSYCALVVPSGIWNRPTNGAPFQVSSYRLAEPFCSRFFWPLEQIDRKLRPRAWQKVRLFLAPV